MRFPGSNRRYTRSYVPWVSDVGMCGFILGDADAQGLAQLRFSCFSNIQWVPYVPWLRKYLGNGEKKQKKKLLNLFHILRIMYRDVPIRTPWPYIFNIYVYAVLYVCDVIWCPIFVKISLHIYLRNSILYPVCITSKRVCICTQIHFRQRVGITGTVSECSNIWESYGWVIHERDIF